MANIIRRPEWALPSRLITPENVFFNRRRFLGQMGVVGGGLLAAPFVGRALAEDAKVAASYPASRNPDFNPGWTLTNEKVAGSYNNFYEFSLDKRITPELTAKFVTAPWPIEITGLIEIGRAHV